MKMKYVKGKDLKIAILTDEDLPKAMLVIFFYLCLFIRMRDILIKSRDSV